MCAITTINVSVVVRILTTFGIGLTIPSKLITITTLLDVLSLLLMVKSRVTILSQLLLFV